MVNCWWFWLISSPALWQADVHIPWATCTRACGSQCEHKEPSLPNIWNCAPNSDCCFCNHRVLGKDLSNYCCFASFPLIVARSFPSSRSDFQGNLKGRCILFPSFFFFPVGGPTLKFEIFFKKQVLIWDKLESDCMHRERHRLRKYLRIPYLYTSGWFLAQKPPVTIKHTNIVTKTSKPWRKGRIQFPDLPHC